MPFTRVHRRPIRCDYNILKEEACALASEVKDITYPWSKNVTNNYRLLADILDIDEYDDLNNIATYTIPHKPASYDPNITNATPAHTRKRMEEEWELVWTLWYIQKGFLKGVVDNFRDALDEQYYSQLCHQLTAYRNITAFQILEHLNNRWCPLDVKAKKELKADTTQSGTTLTNNSRPLESASTTTNAISFDRTSPSLMTTNSSFI
jgi:hypothetical protein